MATQTTYVYELNTDLGPDFNTSYFDSSILEIASLSSTSTVIDNGFSSNGIKIKFYGTNSKAKFSFSIKAAQNNNIQQMIPTKFSFDYKSDSPNLQTRIKNFTINSSPLSIGNNELLPSDTTATGFDVHDRNYSSIIPNITPVLEYSISFELELIALQFNNFITFGISNITIELDIILNTGNPGGNPIPRGGICFPASTPITTNQGPVSIELLDPSIHTIRGKRIVDITKTINDEDKYLVCFEPDSIGKNIPSDKTIMSKDHKLLYKGMMSPADAFLNSDNIYRVKYNGEILYNVLMETHDRMMVNNLICETLDPANDVAELYKALRHMSKEDQNEYIDEINAYRAHLKSTGQWPQLRNKKT